MTALEGRQPVCEIAGRVSILKGSAEENPGLGVRSR
jgi:hypothetical protein